MKKKLFKAWYAKEPTFMASKDLRVETLEETHKWINTLVALDLEDVFKKMQGEMWSPNGEMRPLIEKMGLHHTSMSVGDVIEDVHAEKFYQVAWAGFDEVPHCDGTEGQDRKSYTDTQDRKSYTEEEHESG